MHLFNRMDHRVGKADKLVFGFSIFILATIPLVFGAVQPMVQFFYTACLLMLFLMRLWFVKPRMHFFSKSFMGFACIMFLVVTLAQCLPLPLAVLKFASPVRAEHLVATNELLGVKRGWFSISYDPYESLAGWVFILGLYQFYLVLSEYCKSDRKRMRVVRVMLAAAVIESFYGLIQVLEPSVGVLWSDQHNSGMARGTFINRNHFAGFIGMVWPLGLGYILGGAYFSRNRFFQREKRQPFKTYFVSEQPSKLCVYIVLLAIMLLTVIFSRSRTGIVSMALGLGVFAALFAIQNKTTLRVFGMIGGAVSILLMFYGLRIGLGPIIERFLKLSDDASRMAMWRDGLALLKDHPLGAGLNTFQQVFPIYRNHSDGFAGQAVHLHNDYLQLLIEAGWPGFMALVGGFFVFIGRGFYQMRFNHKGPHPSQTLIVIGAISGLVSMAFHCFFDFNLRIPANALYFTTLLAIVHGYFRANYEHTSKEV